MNGPTLLELKGVSRSFGGVRAVAGLDMVVKRGSIHGLIGPNGAGKTTAFNLISGLLSVSGGTIVLEGRDITAEPVHARVAAGVCRTFQTPRLFDDMTVIETVMTGRHIRSRIGVVGSMFRMQAKRSEEDAIFASAIALIERVGLGADAGTLARNLSYGHRRVLEIARALAVEPKILLLDEVTAGLNPVETNHVAAIIRQIVADGMTVVLVEHDMRFVMGLCSQITVLNFGQTITTGSPVQIAAHPDVIVAYLGRPKGPPTFRQRKEKENKHV